MPPPAVFASRSRRPLMLAALLIAASAPAPAVELAAEYLLEYRRSVDGGLAEGGTWLDQLTLSASDDQRWHLSVLVTNNNTFSDRLAGDLQASSNLDADDTQRLYEAWYQWQLGEIRLLAGLYDLNSEFDAIDAAGLFQHSSFGIGPDFSQSGERGPSIFPHAAFALRLDGGNDRHGWRVALLDAVPGSRRDERATSVQFHRDEGALLVGEIERPGELRLAVGGWSYSEPAPRWDGGESRQHGLYALGETSAVETRWGELRSFARIGAASSDTLSVARYLGAGLVLAPSESHALGVGIAHAALSSGARDELRDAGQRPASAELAIEVTWRWQLNEHFALQPDVQYLRHPGGRADLDAAKVVALRAELAF